MKIMDDYKKVVESEGKKEFSFVPDTMALTPEEFSAALLKYANDNQMDIVITKESMYPEFELDGIEYAAERVFGRLGAVIRCYMRNMEDGEVKELPEEARKKMKLVYKLVGPAIAVLFVFLFALSRQFHPVAILAGVMIVFVMYVFLSFYKNLR